MPVMDGYELVRELRHDPATRGIPVVFYTAHYGEHEARALALSLGVSEVLIKPAESADVLAIVGRVLSRESATGMTPDAALPVPAFDRAHLRLLTDKLSEKAGDLRSANARLRALINIGLELASERDADRLLENVCASARDLFGATYVTLGILNRNDRQVKRFITYGVDAATWIETGAWIRQAIRQGIPATVVAERRAVRGEISVAIRRTATRAPSDVQTFVAAPIASPAQVYGWICRRQRGTIFHRTTNTW